MVNNVFTSREAARSREGVVLPGEEEEDVCLKKGSFASWFMVVSYLVFYAHRINLLKQAIKTHAQK